MTAALVALGAALAVTVAGVRLAPISSRRPLTQPSAPSPASAGATEHPGSRHRRLRVIGLALASALVLVSGVVVVAAGVVAVAALVSRTLRRRRMRRRQHLIDSALPDAIELLVLMLHAGLSLPQALRELAACAPTATLSGFRTVVHRLDRGQRLADALSALPEQLGPAARSVADQIAVADRYGLPLAPLLEQLGTEIRLSRRRSVDAEARTLPVRMSFPLVVTTLPAFVLLAIVPAVAGALTSIRGLGP